MKKFLTLLLVIVTATFLFTGCDSTSMSYKAQYWHENIAVTDYHPFSEICEYDVKIAKSKPSNSTEVLNELVSMEISSGKYVTTLKMSTLENGKPCYIYTTKLLIEGKYVFKNAETPFKNDVETNTVFKTIVDDFMPISSSKKSNSTTTVIATNDSFNVYDFNYEYNINYKEKNAETKYKLNSNVVNNESGKVEPIEKNTTFKNYADGPYVDNELLLLLPRAYDYSVAFSRSFNTIDVVTQKSHKMAYYGMTSDGKNADIKKFNIKYKLNGVEISDEALSAAKVNVKIDDTTHRHRMVKSYVALNDMMGYLEYSLVNVIQS